MNELFKYNGTVTAVLVAICVVTGGYMKGAELYSFKGKISDKTSDWKFIPSANPGGQTYNEAEGYYPDKGGKLLGPDIPLEKENFKFYMLSFDAKAPAECYWGVLFQNANGKTLVSDVYSSVYGGNVKRHYTQVVYGRENAVSIRPFFQSVKGIEVWNLSVKPISSDSVAKWCDSVYQSLPPLTCKLSPDRLKLLPKTVRALKDSTPWRVVMLGDSIINDTFNSNFQALVKRDYPKSNLKFICSVRGSTGCWYYQKQKHFGEYVTDLKPDLLIIGGISQKGDLDAIRQVIELTKENIGCEILLVSGPLGKDWREYDQAKTDERLPEQTCKPDLFDAKLRELAGEQHVAFLDAASLWHNYLGKSKMPWQWFHRDAVHGNDRGKQIVGRILVEFFLFK